MGFCTLHVSKDKIKNNAAGSSHLTNDGKHILRQHVDPEKVKNIDPSKSGLNEILIDRFDIAKDSSKTLATETKKYIEERGLKIRNSETIICNKIVLGMPAGKHSDKDIKKWRDESMKFLKSKFGEENLTVAALHKDESQIHIEAYFIPVVDNKLNYKALAGGHIAEASKKMSALQDEYAKFYKPLGYERGNGENTNGLTQKEYKQAIKYIKTADLEQAKVPEVDEVGFFNKSTIIEQQEKKIAALEKNNKALKQQARKSVFYKEKYANTFKAAKAYKSRAIKAEKKIEYFETEKKDLITSHKKDLKAADRNYSQLEDDLKDMRGKYTKVRRELDILKNPEFEEAKKKLDERLKQEEKTRIENEKQKQTVELKTNPSPKPTPTPPKK
jgi:hypothetical protein